MGDAVVHRDHSESAAFPHPGDRGQCLSAPAHRSHREDESDVNREGRGAAEEDRPCFYTRSLKLTAGRSFCSFCKFTAVCVLLYFVDPVNDYFP